MNSIKTKLYHLRKRIYHSLFWRRIENPSIVFVMGCQRSGTTLMMDLFDADGRTAIYKELSRAFLSSQRLRPVDEILTDHHMSGARIRAYKPLLDSHRIDEFVGKMNNLTVIWMYRDYKSVSVSSNRRFSPGTAIRDLLPIVENQSSDWRNQGISEATRAQIGQFFSEDMNEIDAGAFFWLARNRILLDSWQQISDCVFLCKYEDLVSDPRRVIAAIYESIGQTLPKRVPSHMIKSNALRRGSGIDLCPDADRLCREALAQLDDLYSRQMRKYSGY